MKLGCEHRQLLSKLHELKCYYLLMSYDRRMLCLCNIQFICWLSFQVLCFFDFAVSLLPQLTGSSVIQPGQPHLSMQLQQRHENSFDDRHKASIGSSSDVKPLLSTLGQSSVVTPADASSTNKVLQFYFVSRV